ncbi:MAG TPA: type II toxin-antitoxin system VapC family toxin [Longimicrobium sp.]
MSDDPAAGKVDARPTVYVETSVISYLAARPSGDLVTRANQKVTADWWAVRGRFQPVISQLVLDEITRGDASYAVQRHALVRTLPLLDITDEVDALAEALLRKASLPSKASSDAVHVAVAALNGIDLLVTWNLKHIANAVIRKRLEGICRNEGFDPPGICTPAELLEE